MNFPLRKIYNRPNGYSQALRDMVVAGCQIIVDVLVASEFVNAYARIEFKLAGCPTGRFKNFRKSVEFKSIAATIAVEVREIFAISNRVESGFSNLNDEDLLNEFSGGDSDFNDLIIADICRVNNYTLVTDDGDFRSRGLAILTANNKLLNTATI